MRRVSWLVVVMACSSSPPQVAPPKPPPKPPGALIQLGEITIRFDGNPIARLHADGRTESVGDAAPGSNATLSPGPTLHADGSIDLVHPGFHARLDSTGTIYVVSPAAPTETFGRFAGDRFIGGDDPKSGIRLDGASLVIYDGSDDKPIGVVEPANLGRTAMVMAAAFMIENAIQATLPTTPP